MSYPRENILYRRRYGNKAQIPRRDSTVPGNNRQLRTERKLLFNSNSQSRSANRKILAVGQAGIGVVAIESLERRTLLSKTALISGATIPVENRPNTNVNADAGQYGVVLLQDNFSGSSLNSANWYVPPFDPKGSTFTGQTQFQVAPYTPPVSDGALHLPVETYNPTANPPGDSFLGSEIISKQQFSVGQGIVVDVTAQVEANDPAGIVAAAFLYSPPASNDAPHDEIDTELLTNNLYQVQTNVYADQPLGIGSPTSVSLTDGDITTSHTYQIMWLPNEVQWSVDGQVIRTETDTVPTGPMALYLNTYIPGSNWTAAYNPDLHPTSNPADNQVYDFNVTSVTVTRLTSGWIDAANMNQISGWAYDPSDSTASINIEVNISGGPTQTVSADQTRTDLQTILGSANHGFTYSTPMLSVGSHTAYIYAVETNGTKVLLGMETLVSQNSLFDEHYYLEMYPNVAAAVADGQFATGYDQYVEYGQYEGYSPSPYWDESWYLEENPDVAAAVKAGEVSSGFMHYYLYGQYENRGGLLYFNTDYYLANNADVAAAIQAGTVASAFQHFCDYGQYEGRNPMLYFSSAVYDADNQDIIPYITGQPFTSDFEQFIEYGQYEDRIASDYYNEQVYLADNPDVAAAVLAGEFPDGFQHWLMYGQYEGRTAV